jgi:transcriptional regulator with XRE-family HTH domain
MLDEAFGRILRELRERSGLSQEELGERTDLHRTYISLLERGLNSPSLRTLDKLSRALGVTLTEMMALTERDLASQPEDRSAAVADVDDEIGELPAGGGMA